MTKFKVAFWLSTTLIFLFEGVMPALTSQSEMAKEGIRHLGYPEYFGLYLAIFKSLGALALIIPQTPRRIKEWAYAGFAFDFTFAFLSLASVDGFNATLIAPVIAFAILAISYLSGEKIRAS